MNDKNSPGDNLNNDSSFAELFLNSDKRQSYKRYNNIILFMTLGLFIMSFIIKIDNTVMLHGEVVPEDKIVKIKHDTGGEIDDVYVKNYQVLNKGDVILKIDAKKVLTSIKQNKTKLKVIDTEIINIAAYLKNNISGTTENSMLKEVEQYLSNITDTIGSAKDLVETNKVISQYKSKVINEKIEQNNLEIDRMSSELKRLADKLDYISEQREIFQQLLKSKNVSKVRAIDYEVKYLDIISEIEKIKSNLNVKKLENKELSNKKIVTEQDDIRDRYEELVALNKEKIDIVSNITQLENMLDNLVLRAPISGIVQGLEIGKGSTIQPGEEIVSIIPHDSNFLFEAKAKLKQKGKINQNTKSHVQFDGFNVLEFNRVGAKIINISPYTFSNEGDEDKFFKIVMHLNGREITSKTKRYSIKPGMSGVAYLTTEKTSLFSYFFGPIYNSLNNIYSEG